LILWERLRLTYQGKLVALAFGKIPDEKLIASHFAKSWKFYRSAFEYFITFVMSYLKQW
ncbi:hypothetical protein EZS27_026455, partial [termite gut metagenome]